MGMLSVRVRAMALLIVSIFGHGDYARAQVYGPRGGCGVGTCASDACRGGALGSYYNNMQLTGLAMVRRDTTIDFDWGGGSPSPLIGEDSYSVRWRALVRPPFTGHYTFYTVTDDGVRLWVNGSQLIDQWADFAPTEWSGSIHLNGGQNYELVMEYFENGGGAMARLLWEGPGTAKQVIPADRMFAPELLDCNSNASADSCEIAGNASLDQNENGILDACPIEATLPQGLKAFAGNHKVTLTWMNYDDPTGKFDHFAVYRTEKPFASVAGLSPLAEISFEGATSYIDATAENGTSYYYALTSVREDGGEITDVEAVGPRTPRSETDLQVVSISRTPRYPRFDATYEFHEITEPSGFGPYFFTAATGLGSGQTANTQRFPNVGQTVTYSALVRNRGTNAWTGTLHGLFSVDGATVGGATRIGTIQPGATLSFQINRAWDGLSHEIGFSIDPADARPENDTLSIDTKSVAFLSYIDASRMESFREETPSYPFPITDDFIDWLNLHMARFNELFAKAGTGKRVHFDVLEVLNDDAPDPAIDTLPFAIFPFRYRAHEGTLRLSGYYDSSEDLDYGLLHEMGHQLGLIDMYQINTGPDQNLVSGMGYSAPACVMNGVSHFLSDHSALAMQHWLDVAHGYFGQYLYAIPAQLRMRFIGFDGNPLEGAHVQVFQKVERPGVGPIITEQVKFEGVTDEDGFYNLPNVPIDANLVPETFAGDALQDNPFGYVAVIGTNGLLHFKVEHQGSVDYAWLDITEANVAYWQGETNIASFERTLALGGEIQLCPPSELTEGNAADWAEWAQDAFVTLADDEAVRVVGSSSLRLETNGGFDTYARYPGNQIAKWNLTDVNSIRASFFAENPNGFQERSPWIRLGSRDGIVEYRTDHDILNNAIGQWVEFVIPISGDATWNRTEIGTPDLTNVNWLEIHADTWDFGYRLWIDGLRFDPNCDTDLVDYGAFYECLDGPDATASSICTHFDFDVDGHVDLADLQLWQAAFTGPHD